MYTCTTGVSLDNVFNCPSAIVVLLLCGLFTVFLLFGCVTATIKRALNYTSANQNTDEIERTFK